MNVWLPKTVKELYTLVDKCARMEEGRKLPHALPARKSLPRRKLGKVKGRTTRSTGPGATTSMNVIKLSSLSRGRKRNMRSVTRKKVRMLLAVRAEVVK